MDITIPTALKSLSMAGSASKALAAWRKKSTGDARSLIDEIGNNLRYLDLVIDDDIDLAKVVKDISVKEFDRLSKEGYNFNALKRKKIPKMPSLDGTDLESWQEKGTQDLVDSIYDKLKDILIKYPHTKSNPEYRWKIRARNIRKRIWLLVKHINS